MRESDIAIVGLGAMLPGGLNVADSWDMILGKRSAIGEVPPSRWEAELYYDPDPKASYRTNSKIGAFLPDDLGFRPRDFGMPPILRDHLDPTQQLALLTARQTLEDAHAADREPRRWAVYIGNLLGGSWKRGEQWIRTQHEKTLWQLRSSDVYQRQSAADRQALEQAIQIHLPWSDQPTMTPDSLPGLLGNLIASRIAHYFNLLGPNFTVDAACATSLAAIELAVLGLRAHRFDAVLAGGVDRIMDASSFIGFSKMGVLSPTHSAPFDASANGFVMGEGAAMFVLKRLQDALDQDDKIYAVIRGVGSSTDGPGRSIAAPSPDGQKRSLHQAYADAGVDPATVDLIECHGTSTPIGDPTEIAALRKIFHQRERNRPIAIGSIKSNIGHLKGAAGAVALLKATLALHHQILPPQINFHTPNPHCEFEVSPFRVQTQPEPWQTHSYPRRSGVSAFGFGGINYHIVLEEFSMASHTTTGVTSTSSSSTTSHSASPAPLPLGMPIIALGAESREALAQQARRWADRLQTDGGEGLLDALRDTPTIAQYPCRVAFYAEDAKEQKELLELLAQSLTSGKSLKKLEAKGVYLREGDVDPGRIAFMFPGQGSQYVHMLSELKERFPVVQETLEEADEIMAELLPRPLSSYISPAPDVDESTAFFELLQTEVLQPAVLTADYAMWRLLSPLMPVELVIGHSLGEYGAAVAAGVFSFADALRIVSARGEAIAAVADQMDDVGAMIGVGTDADTVEKLLAEMKDEGYVIVANKNCPTQTIIAGATQATMKAAENLEKLGYDTIQLPVSHAFHSDIVAPASPFLLKELEKIDVHPPKITILSNETATPYPTDENAPHWIRDTLSVHLARPVEWQAMIEWAYREGFHTFVEVGPKRALSSFVRDILVNQQHQSYFSSHPKFGELNSLGRMLAALTADGILPYGTEKPSIQARPKQTQTPNTPSHGLPYQHSTPKPPTSQPTPTFTIPTGSHPPAGSRDSSQPGVQVPGQRAQLPQQPSYSAPSYAPQESGSYTALPASPGAEGHTSQGTGYGWPIPSGAMQPSAYALPAVPPYQGHPWPPMPYGAPGYAPPMMPYAPTPHYPPPPYGYPMYNYPQPPLWQDPRFWQFVASQGPYLIQHLIASYQTVAPHLAPMRATPPAYVPAMPTYQHMPAVPATAPPVPPAAYQQPSGPTTPPPWAVSPQATYAAPAVAPPPPQKATPAAQPAPFNWGNGTSMPGATFPAPSTPVISPNIPTPAPSVETPQIELPAVSAEGDELETMILTLVADRTGYEVEELDLDEHLEADLGIDSIRQVEVMAELRDTLKLPRDDSFKITDYPTLRSLIAYVRQNIPGRQGREARSTGSGRDDTATSG